MSGVVFLAVLSLGGLGLLLGGFLALAYTRLAVKLNPKQKAILEALPGANCGACGFPGCESYAEMVASGKVDPNLCTVGGGEVAAKIGEVLGVEVKVEEPKAAVLLCGGRRDQVGEKYIYFGITDCRAAMLLAEGGKVCRFGCIGLGTCEEACPFGAIQMTEAGLPTIDEDKCTGCGICVDTCPKSLFQLIPKPQKVYVACSSTEPGKAVRKTCRVGCVACGVCVKSCPYHAIVMENNLAVIDYEKCENCGICVYKCPTKSIVDKLPARPKAFIGTDCTGCELCKEVCPTKPLAITGEADKHHKVDLKLCIGCGLCFETCPEKAITMAGALGYGQQAA